MKKQIIFLGVDISKRSLDICVANGSGHESHVIENTIEAVQAFFDTQFGHQELVIGMENTGRYNWALLSVLGHRSDAVYVIAPLHLKRSLGLVRGKSDKIDAQRICQFTEKHHQEMKPWKPRRTVVTELGVLLSQRKRLQKVRGQVIRGQQDLAIVKDCSVLDIITDTNHSLVVVLDAKLKLLEKAISKLVAADKQLAEQSELLQSITGVGKVLSWNLLYRTNEFRSIKDPRKLACYAGVVPFEHTSGTSIRGKKRVSPYADRSFKSILHMAAMRATRIEGELQDYYLRKVAEGKNKMSVLNAVRNKIIHRAYAVIKHKKPYERYLELS